MGTQRRPQNYGSGMAVHDNDFHNTTFQQRYADKTEFDAQALQLENVKHKSVGAKCIAHRGLETYAPENTLPAFDLAGQMGMYGIEVDLHLTSDAEWVIMHDDDVARMTDGTGNIIDLTLAQIKALNVDAGNNVSLYTGTKIPTLKEALAICRKYGMMAFIEIKTDNTDAQIQGMLDIIKEYGMYYNTVITSIIQNYITQVRSLDNIISCEFVGATSANLSWILANNIQQVNLAYSTTTQDDVDLWHSYGIKVGVYTPTSWQNVVDFTAMGVDFLTVSNLVGV